MREHFSDSDLDSVDSVFIKGLYLRNLDPINLYHSAGGQLAPLVPEVRHSDFVTNKADSFWQTVYWRRRLETEIFVDFIFKRFERFALICNAELFGTKNFIIVKTIGYRQGHVLQTNTDLGACWEQILFLLNCFDRLFDWLSSLDFGRERELGSDDHLLEKSEPLLCKSLHF